MTTILRTCLNNSDTYYHYKWLLSVARKYSLEAINPPKSDKLRLILGVGRSGTSWIGQTLSRTKTPLRYLGEPLFHFSPSLMFSSRGDHTAINSCAATSMLNRLKTVYRLLGSKRVRYSKYYSDEFLIRDDKNFDHTLIKEVHSLLQTEFLVDKLKCPTILVYRDPMYVIDSLFDAQTLDTLYLNNEFTYMLNPIFYRHHFQDEAEVLMQCTIKIDSLEEGRLKEILKKFFSVSLINRMFKEIARSREYVRIVKYENLCLRPDDIFLELSNFFGFQYEAGDSHFSEIQSNASASSTYSVNRNTKKQIARHYRFLKSADVSFVENFLNDNSVEL